MREVPYPPLLGIIQHDNYIHLEVHEPAFPIHFYRHTSDHQACESAVSRSARRGVAIWLSHTQLLLYTCIAPSVPTPESAASFSRGRVAAAHAVINPRRACAARVTVLGHVSVLVRVLVVCLHSFSYYRLGLSIL